MSVVFPFVCHQLLLASCVFHSKVAEEVRVLDIAYIYIYNAYTYIYISLNNFVPQLPHSFLCTFNKKLAYVDTEDSAAKALISV